MSHIGVIILAIVSIAVTTCRALPDIHKQMSAQQLQSVFHVETSEAVPHYEVIQLQHHHSEEGSAPQYNNYRRRKRSIEPLSSSSLHHVKKDLSKTPYESESKRNAAAHVNSLDDNAAMGKDVKHIKEHKVSLDAFGKKLNLTLKKTQGLFKRDELHKLPMWFMDNEANSTQGEMNLQKIEDELSHSSEHIGEVFQDEDNMAAILMRRHEVTGDLVMEGSIGHDMVIKPLPHDLSPNPEASHHVIYKRDVEAMEHLSDFAYMEPDDLATHDKLEKLQERHKRSAHRNTLADIEEEQERLEAEDDLEADETAPHRRPKRQAPYMIYPEILVIVDYDGYRLHGGDNLQVKRYFIAFWNGVDLRYRLLKDPKIRVSIAGIIISRGRDATPYLERNRVGRDAIDSAAALTDMGKYLFRERRLPVYDIAVAITKYDMCRRRKGGRCTKGTAGFAYVGGACVVNRRLEKVNSVAIIEDTGGFSGIIVAAHEVGHLLGAVHDGSPPPSYLGGPGAQRCRWEDGFIMSDLRHTERGFRWSACSVQSFQHFLNGATATCLYNVPHEDNALGRSLPGTLLSLDAQCRRDRGTYACFKDERVCAQLFCFDAQTGYCVAYRPAAEGSTCGNNLHCLDGRCTPLQVASNLISNYGAQYRSGYNSSLNNAASKHLHNSKPPAHGQGNGDDDEEDNEDNDNEDDDDDDDDGGDDNDESNETIEKQKRKLTPPISTKSTATTTTTTTTITTASGQQQQQLQLQASPPNPSTTKSTAKAVAATAPASATASTTFEEATHAPPPLSLPYGVKSSSAKGYSVRSLSSPSIYDTYVKKLQALNGAPAATTTEASAGYAKTLDKTERAPSPTISAQYEGAQYLKRTLASTPTLSSYSSSISNNNNKNAYTQTSQTTTKTSITSAQALATNSASGSSTSSNSYTLIPPSTTTTIRETDTSPQQTSHTSPPAYVTNYIGDNTQRLAAIVQQHEQPYKATTITTGTASQKHIQPNRNSHQQQQLQHSHPPHNNNNNNNYHQQQQQQQQHTDVVVASTRRPKIKTQKLIRRLRTQIK